MRVHLQPLLVEHCQPYTLTEPHKVCFSQGVRRLRGAEPRENHQKLISFLAFHHFCFQNEASTAACLFSCRPAASRIPSHLLHPAFQATSTKAHYMAVWPAWQAWPSSEPSGTCSIGSLRHWTNYVTHGQLDLICLRKKRWLGYLLSHVGPACGCQKTTAASLVMENGHLH